MHNELPYRSSQIEITHGDYLCILIIGFAYTKGLPGRASQNEINHEDYRNT